MRLLTHLGVSNGAVIFWPLVLGHGEVANRPLAVSFSGLLPRHRLHHLRHQRWVIQKTFLPISGSDHTTHVPHHELQ